MKDNETNKQLHFRVYGFGVEWESI